MMMLDLVEVAVPSHAHAHARCVVAVYNDDSTIVTDHATIAAMLDLGVPLDVVTDADVDEAYRLCVEQAAMWELHDISKPAERHGTYSFMFWDLDDNAWEILSNPKGGYTWIFEQGDLEGKGHFESGFRHKRPDVQD